MSVRRLTVVLLVAIMVCAGVSVVLMAQQVSTTETEKGVPSRQVKVERGEVVYVSGNEVVVRMEDGVVRHVTVPDSARATVDGKEVSVHDLKPGMKLQRTIATTTRPQVVTTVTTIKGKVFNVNPPNSVILTLPEGNKQYKIPKDQKFMIDGEEKTAFDLRKGMNVSATVIQQVPETVVAQQRKTTGTAPPPPATPPMEGVLLIEEVPAPKAVAKAEPAPTPAPAAAPEPAPKKLPKTGSPLPLMGLLGLLASGLSFGMRWLRRS